MIQNSPMRERNSPIIDILNSSYVKPDNILDHFKKLKLTEFYEKRIVDGKSSTDAAKDIGILLSTIKRYKKDQGFKPERKLSHKTHEQKNQIYMKGVLTKMKNKEIRDETDKVKNDDNLTFEEKSQRIKEIGDKYNIQDSPLASSSIKKNKNKSQTKKSDSSLNIEGKGKEIINTGLSSIKDLASSSSSDKILASSSTRLSSDDKKFMNSYDKSLNPYHKPVDDVMKDLNDRL